MLPNPAKKHKYKHGGKGKQEQPGNHTQAAVNKSEMTGNRWTISTIGEIVDERGECVRVVGW